MRDDATTADHQYAARVARVDQLLYPVRCKLAYAAVLELMGRMGR